MKTAHVRRAAILAAVGALVVGGPVLVAAEPAQAHNYLVSSTPSAGETLTELPERFLITTNDSLLTVGGGTGGFAFQIVDAAGLHYETGCLEVEGPTMSMEPRLGAAGEYTVLWQVVSADGHSVSDSIPFTWAPPEGFEPATGAASAPACGDEPEAGAQSPPASSPPAASGPDRDAAVIPVSDLLWIGGALLAVGVAVAIAIVVAGRRKP